MKMTLKQLADDLARDNKTELGKPIPCRCCTKQWTPTSYNFYGLCDGCFKEFNQQKMSGRLSATPSTENVDEWIAAKRQQSRD